MKGAFSPLERTVSLRLSILTASVRGSRPVRYAAVSGWRVNGTVQAITTSGVGRLRLAVEEGLTPLKSGTAPRSTAAAPGLRGAIAENPSADLLLDRGPVHVAHDDDGHQLRPVPRVVEVRERLAPGLLDHAVEADRHAVRKARAGGHEPELRRQRAVGDRVRRPPFAHDNRALLLDHRGVKQQAAPVVGQDPKPLRKRRRCSVRKVDLIERALERG